MPEAVSDLDDTCAASHPPFLTLIFYIRCSIILDPGEGEVAWSKST